MTGRSATTETKSVDTRRNASPTAKQPQSPIAAPGNRATLRLLRKCDCGGGPDCDCDMGPNKHRHTDLHRSATESSTGPADAPPIVHDVLRSPGAALDPGTRHFFESRFGRDFGAIRLHTDSRAAQSARAVRAQAYAVGNDIAFAEGRYAPATSEGRHLLAHELAHTAQQQTRLPAAGSRLQSKLTIGAVNDPLEAEADRIADRVMRSAAPGISISSAIHKVSRKCSACEENGNMLQTTQDGSTHAGDAVVRRSTTPGKSRSRGKVLFIQVDRTASTITFVTESGSLVYPLLTPTDVPAGNHKFTVKVTGNNLQLTAPADVTQNSPFRYRIAPGQPNPADLLRSVGSVDVQVIESNAGDPSSPTSQTGTPADVANSKIKFRVQQLTPDAFKAMTGLSADALQEGVLVNSNSLTPSAIASSTPQPKQGAEDSPFPTPGRGAGLIPGIGGGALLTRFPSYPIPPNATGIIWTQLGAGHLTTFSNVGGNIVPRGFRYDMDLNVWMRIFPNIRESLNNPGVPGSFQNDFLFTLMPRQTIVYRASDPAAAEAFAQQLINTRYDRTYRFPPRVGKDVYLCGSNCITVPAEEATAALGVKPEILTPDGPVNILEAGRPTPGAPFDPSQAGRGTAVQEWLGQDDSYFAERGLTRAPVGGFTPAARGAVGFIKVGGTILLIYGAYRTYERIKDTPEAERPRVESQEAGSWVGGTIGSALGGAAAGAVLCLPAGPADLICVAGGFVGGVLGGLVGGTAGAVVGDAAYVHDCNESWLDEAYRRQTEQQGDPIPAGAERAVDDMIGPPLF